MSEYKYIMNTNFGDINLITIETNYDRTNNANYIFTAEQIELLVSKTLAQIEANYHKKQKKIKFFLFHKNTNQSISNKNTFITCPTEIKLMLQNSLWLKDKSFSFSE